MADYESDVTGNLQTVIQWLLLCYLNGTLHSATCLGTQCTATRCFVRVYRRRTLKPHTEHENLGFVPQS